MNLKFFIVVVSLMVILFSFASITNSITGFATTPDGAVVNVTITNTVAINFTTDYVNFGAGTVNLGNDNASIDTQGNVVGGNWTPSTEGFILDNIGNSNVSVHLKGGKTAEEFLGGTSPAYQYSVTNSEVGSCSSSDIVLGDWYEVNVTGDGTLICNNFLPEQSSNSLTIDVKLVIPSDAVVGELTDSFTATGSSI